MAVTALSEWDPRRINLPQQNQLRGRPGPFHCRGPRQKSLNVDGVGVKLMAPCMYIYLSYSSVTDGRVSQPLDRFTFPPSSPLTLITTTIITPLTSISHCRCLRKSCNLVVIKWHYNSTHVNHRHLKIALRNTWCSHLLTFVIILPIRLRNTNIEFDKATEGCIELFIIEIYNNEEWDHSREGLIIQSQLPDNTWPIGQRCTWQQNRIFVIWYTSMMEDLSVQR